MAVDGPHADAARSATLSIGTDTPSAENTASAASRMRWRFATASRSQCAVASTAASSGHRPGSRSLLTNGTFVPYSGRRSGVIAPNISRTSRVKPPEQGVPDDKRRNRSRDYTRDGRRQAARARPAPVVVTRGHRHRPADDRARRVRRRRGAAFGPEGSAHLHRQPPVGDERLHARLRQPPAARRADRGLPRSPPHVRRRPHRLRPVICPGRPVPGRRHALRRPGPAGSFRRPHGASLALASNDDVHRGPRSGPGPSASTAPSPEAGRRWASSSVGP